MGEKNEEPSPLGSRLGEISARTPDGVRQRLGWQVQGPSLWFSSSACSVSGEETLLLGAPVGEHSLFCLGLCGLFLGV